MDKRLTKLLTPYGAAGVAATGSLLLLAGAHAFERFGKLAPCMLCLDQREAHWTALAAALITLAIWRFFKASRAVAASLGVTALIYAFSAVLAAYHAGVEWKFWPGPATCSGGAMINSPEELFAQLESGAPMVSCSDAAWRFLGISMAGYNALFSLALAGLTAWATVRMVRALRDERFALTPSATR
ncbi:disulfide bond formation protein B [Aquisalinus flavus]|uniref:Disulfide bond formation protein B n=1 Tax=Aquisalinus flavus TaxID=1526572 RepID=A0A8J2V403_9PROT|nr:disulfide bond formation protein B [Aquisalinus flavus]MBD0427106.1 disulfide bond formation protein B [Aquisalinus flavus]UNE46928.1 disulfide bond formation protein B [Aquisalinus flavus]GGC98443.1 hypothetical protein GCM10011342_04200 [Aquisalinus flavus]